MVEGEEASLVNIWRRRTVRLWATISACSGERSGPLPACIMQRIGRRVEWETYRGGDLLRGELHSLANSFLSGDYEVMNRKQCMNDAADDASVSDCSVWFVARCCPLFVPKGFVVFITTQGVAL